MWRHKTRAALGSNIAEVGQLEPQQLPQCLTRTTGSPRALVLRITLPGNLDPSPSKPESFLITYLSAHHFKERPPRRNYPFLPGAQHFKSPPSIQEHLLTGISIPNNVLIVDKTPLMLRSPITIRSLFLSGKPIAVRNTKPGVQDIQCRTSTLYNSRDTIFPVV